MRVRLLCRPRASRFGAVSESAATCSMRRLVAAATGRVPFSAAETVLTATCARSATSRNEDIPLRPCIRPPMTGLYGCRNVSHNLESVLWRCQYC